MEGLSMWRSPRTLEAGVVAEVEVNGIGAVPERAVILPGIGMTEAGTEVEEGTTVRAKETTQVAREKEDPKEKVIFIS